MSTPLAGKDELLARAGKPSEEALRLHPFYRGKMQTTPKCAIRGFEDFAIWYSPGVAAPCRAIQKDPDLVFPGLFRGALDVRARRITDGMATAVARELARFATERGIHDDDILPRMDEWDAFPRVAAAAGMAAQAEGVARLQRSHSELQAYAAKLMREARETTRVLMREGLIAAPPGP